MTSSESSPRRRIPGLLKVLLVLLIVGGVAALAVSAFKVGVLAGLAAAGGVLVVYTVPATILDWPRLSLGDVGDFFSAIGEMIASFFSSLFDW